MKHFKLTRLADGEVEFVSAADDQDAPPGYDPEAWSTELLSAEPTELETTTAAMDLEKAEAWALEKLEDEAEQASFDAMKQLRRQVVTVLLWLDVQRLKQMQAAGTIPSDPLERAKQLPALMAVVNESGQGLATVATAIENRLWDRVRRIATVEAKMLLARDAVRAAATKEDKLTAADIDWAS